MTILTTLFSPKGRVGRAGFAFLLFVHLVILKGFGITDWLLGLALGHGRFGIEPPLWVFTLAELWIVNVLFVRRWHDLGWSGRTMLILLIPILGAFLLIPGVAVLLFAPGKAGPNRYGPPETFRETLDHFGRPARAAARLLSAFVARERLGSSPPPRPTPARAVLAKGQATPRDETPARAGSHLARPRATAPASAPPPPVVVRRARRGLFG